MSFEQSAKDVMQIKGEPTNDEKLQVYALFKQGTVGDCNTESPGMFDFKGRAKWNAWNEKKGLSVDIAKKEYIRFIDGLKVKYGF